MTPLTRTMPRPDRLVMSGRSLPDRVRQVVDSPNLCLSRHLTWSAR